MLSRQKCALEDEESHPQQASVDMVRMQLGHTNEVATKGCTLEWGRRRVADQTPIKTGVFYALRAIKRGEQR